MSDDIAFIETREYRRFQEFCDACREYRYIGLCYGPPGVGKTLSARHYTNWNRIEAYNPDVTKGDILLGDVLGSSSAFYTVQVINSPRHIKQEIQLLRQHLRSFIVEELMNERDILVQKTLKCKRKSQKGLTISQAGLAAQVEKAELAVPTLGRAYLEKEKEVEDPTSLIVVDEADRLKMAGLEQLRDIFDCGGVGMILIGMPGLEKQMARYPQFYSRIGFVHEFRTLAQDEIRQLLAGQWHLANIPLAQDIQIDHEAVANIIRVTGGNFRLLHRLLAQIARVMVINELDTITAQAVQAARESLVIGTT